MQHIAQREFDISPEAYANYLKGQISWANSTLSDPPQAWSTGDSHDIARAVILEAQTAMIDLRMEHGLFHADGSIAGFRT